MHDDGNERVYQCLEDQGLRVLDILIKLEDSWLSGLARLLLVLSGMMV